MGPRAAAHLILIGCVLLACIPGELAVSAGGSDGTGAAGTTCEMTLCGDACVDVTTNSDHCGACDQPCTGDRRACVAGICQPGCPNRTFFVATYGSDDSDGCSPETAKATPLAAILRAEDIEARDHEIHVAEGLYARSGYLHLGYPVSLLGAYDETSWERTPTYGYPTFDGENETILEVEDPQAGNIDYTLNVNTAGALRVDGLTIRGPSIRDSVGLSARGDALVLSNNKIMGGGLPSAGTSTGLLVRSGLSTPSGADSTLTIEKNAILGGVGGEGSVGVKLAQGAGGRLVIQSNIIDGGTGSDSGSPGSIGLHLDQPQPALSILVSDNEIRGGAGTAYSGVATIGILLTQVSEGDPGAIEVIRNQIDGGAGACMVANCEIVALQMEARDRVRIVGNHIYGGDIPLSGGATYGVRVDFGSGGVVENNFVHAGNKLGAEPPSSKATAIELRLTQSVQLRNNTLFGGPFGAHTQRVLDIRAATELAVVENNLLLGASVGSPEVGLTLGCSGVGGNELDRFRNNVFLTQQGAAILGTDCESVASTAKEIPDVETLIVGRVPMAVVSGNWRLGTCTATPGCDSFSDCNGQTLAQCLFETFSASDHGYSTLLGAGWRLRTGLPCSVSKGGVDLSTAMPPSPAADSYGNIRNVPWSVGAEELEDPTCLGK